MPPPHLRDVSNAGVGAVRAAVGVLTSHAGALATLARYSKTDLRHLPVDVSVAAAGLQEWFLGNKAKRPSFLSQVAALITPRIEGVLGRLRRRLGRKSALLPLGRLREMNQASLRANARRPGVSLIEKAGPRQELMGVQRVERFDTTENRLLRALAERLAVQCRIELRSQHVEEKAVRSALAPMRALLRAATKVTKHEDLAHIGRYLAGARPTNAMMGDPDYRMIWRVWRLMREDDRGYEGEWRALEQAWIELVLWACWVLLDNDEGLEPVPEWGQTRRERIDGSRLSLGAPRRWVSTDDERAVCITARADHDERVVLLGACRSSCTRSRGCDAPQVLS